MPAVAHRERSALASTISMASAVAHPHCPTPPSSRDARSSRPASPPSLSAIFGPSSSATYPYSSSAPPAAGEASGMLQLDRPARPPSRTSSSTPAAPPSPMPVRTASPPPQKLKRRDYAVPSIPPFRGGSSGTPSSASSTPAAGAGNARSSRTAPSAIPTVLTQTDEAPRRVSYPSVFSLPRQDHQRPRSGASSSGGSAATMGLGIAGVGVGAAGAKEALVIERVGEGPAREGDAQGRRGSLKRVLISDGEDELASVRVAAVSADNRMDRGGSCLPLPLQPAPPLARRESASSCLRHAGSSSPDQGRDSPTSSNKRQRIGRLSPLESLATTATDLLFSGPPTTFGAHSPESTGSTPQGGIPLSTLVLGQPIQEQQEREFERRRESASLVSSAPAPSASATMSTRRPSSAVAPHDAGSGLARRRGHRPPAVATGSNAPPAPSSSAAPHRGSFSATHHFDSIAPPRSAPVDIPSVLVGSPMEASFAARIARERGVLAPIRSGPPSTVRESAPAASRRQSQSTASGGGGSGGQPQPQIGQDRLSPSALPQSTRLPSLARATGSSSSRPYWQPEPGQPPGLYPHPFQAFPPPAPATAAYAGGPLSPLPPLSASIGAPGAPSAAAGSPSFSALPPHSAGPAPPPPPPSLTPAAVQAAVPASKQAFLNLFSTFYDALADSRVLASSLDAHVARAGQLLATLQHAETSFEAAIAAVRAESEHRSRAVEDRLARLERELLERGGELAPADVRRPSGDSVSSGAVADSEASAPVRERDRGKAAEEEMEE
ncbi:hypothetical protein JCM3770_003992 [Rhodotorula araucariae]